MIPLAFSFAVTALVGSALGEGNKKKAFLYLRVTSVITVVIVVLLSTSMLVFRWQISEMYTIDDEVVEISARNFLIAGTSFLVDGINCEMKGLIIGLGL